jgi:hypothetical protein
MTVSVILASNIGIRIDIRRNSGESKCCGVIHTIYLREI